MTLEQESFDSDRDYTRNQGLLNRIVHRIEELALPRARRDFGDYPFGEAGFE